MSVFFIETVLSRQSSKYMRFSLELLLSMNVFTVISFLCVYTVAKFAVTGMTIA